MSAINAPTPSPVPDQASLGQRAARSIRHPLSRTLLVLTFTTGLVDAVSYLGIGHVFTANMTGNIVFLGFGIAGSGGLPVLAPVVSLVAFLVGGGLRRSACFEAVGAPPRPLGSCIGDRGRAARDRGDHRGGGRRSPQRGFG